MPGDRVRYDTHAAQRPVQQTAHPDDTEAVPSHVPDLDVRAGQWRQPEVGRDVVGAGGEVALQPGEDERQPATGPAEQRPRPEPHVAAPLPGPALGDRTTGQGQPLGVRRDDTEPHGTRTGVRPGGVEPCGEYGGVLGVEEGTETGHAVGGEKQDRLGLGDLGGSGPGHLGGSRSGLGDMSGDGTRLGHVDGSRSTLGDPSGSRNGPGHLGGSGSGGGVDRRTAGGLLQHHVGVDPAEPEGVHGGPADRLPDVGLPGAGPVQGAKARGGEGGVGVLAVQGGQQGAVVEREGGFHQARDSGGRHGVADHRLHRAEDRVEDVTTPLPWPEHLCQGGEFGRITGGRRGAVRLQQADGVRCGRIEAGGVPGLPYGAGLPARVGGDESRRTAVSGHARAPDHRVHAVAVALGVREPLQDDDARALADEDAVRVTVEGTDALGRGQGAQLGEDAPEGDVVAVVHSPGEHHVAAAGGEFVDRLVDGDERGGAGRVQGVGGAAQVEPVGDAGRGQVGDQADRGLRAVGAEPFGERGANPVELVRFQSG